MYAESQKGINTRVERTVAGRGEVIESIFKPITYKNGGEAHGDVPKPRMSITRCRRRRRAVSHDNALTAAPVVLVLRILVDSWAGDKNVRYR